jgi:hypothetical protein
MKKLLLTAILVIVLVVTSIGSTAAGADTNVQDGVYAQYNNSGSYDPKTNPPSTPLGVIGGGLLGGGFDYVWNPTIPASFMAATSQHDVGGTITTAWGAGGAVIGVAEVFDSGEGLDCGSCHDPHGSTNYRILNTTINSIDVFVPDSSAASNKYTTEAWEYDADAAGDASISQLCAACHGAYHDTDSGSGAGGNYTHRVDMSWDAVAEYAGAEHPELGSVTYNLPLADDVDNIVPNEIVLCTTCHFSHGSAAVMESKSESATLAEIPGGSGNSSALLRLDSRSVCQSCHQK